MNKKYLACYLDPKYRSFSHSYNCSWFFYELNAKGTYYEDVEDTNRGFSVQKIESLKSMTTVQLSDSVDELKAKTKKLNFIWSYGTKDKEDADFNCPKCGWGFLAPSYCGGEYDSFVDEANMKIDCLCGCSFHNSIEFVVTPKSNIKIL